VLRLVAKLAGQTKECCASPVIIKPEVMDLSEPHHLLFLRM